MNGVRKHAPILILEIRFFEKSDFLNLIFFNFRNPKILLMFLDCLSIKRNTIFLKNGISEIEQSRINHKILLMFLD